MCSGAENRTDLLRHMPAMASASAYVASKLAATKIYETFGAENPHIEVAHIHPGVVYSELNVKSGVTPTDDGMPPKKQIGNQSELTSVSRSASLFRCMAV